VFVGAVDDARPATALTLQYINVLKRTRFRTPAFSHRSRLNASLAGSGHNVAPTLLAKFPIAAGDAVSLQRG
jgi:hypothetical protein